MHTVQPSSSVNPVNPPALTGAGLVVRRSQRTKAIENIQVGDIVWAWSDAKCAPVTRRVVRLFRHSCKPVLAICFFGARGRAETVEATVEHPFWVKGRGWVAARDLRKGDMLRSMKGDDLFQIQSVDLSTRTADVHNFEVEGEHNYFVAKAGVLVHNSSVEDGPGASKHLRKYYDILRTVDTAVAKVGTMAPETPGGAQPWVYNARRDPLTAAIFNGRVELTGWRGRRDGEPVGWKDQKRGYILGPRQVAAAVGAEDGASLSIETRTWNGQTAIGVLVDHPLYLFPKDVALLPELNGGTVALGQIHYNEEHQGAGAGARAFAVMAHTAAQLGYSQIDLGAARGSDYMKTGRKFGHYVWPLYGVDAELDPLIRSSLAGTPIASARTVLEATSTEVGRKIWWERGSTFQGRFNLSPGSKSWEVLNNYLAKSNIVFRPDL